MEKTYVGSGKLIKTSNGELMKVSFSRRDLETMTANLNDKGYINLVVSERREPDKYGNTHSVSIDTWKPTAK
jgi:hypothetical protein